MPTMLPSKNADGLPTIALTEEQRYFFDLRGWMLIPSVLSEDEVAEMKEFCYRLHEDKNAVPLAQRSSVGGPLQTLTDHPVVVGFMNELVAYEHTASESGYGFRLEGTFLTIRAEGHDNYSPHGGGGMFNFHGNSHHYGCRPGAISSGLTRVVWELNPVRKGEGGTVFLTGSHKAAFPAPKSVWSDRHSPHWEDYECPAGSCLIFTEAISHSGARWTNSEWDRVAIFNCYNTVGAKWHEWQPHPELLADMPPLRQSLFRGVYCERNQVSG
ncbi:phytanoyl-CoA dioxygenase family protein [Armatimonas sp.]|uniref:phytanoyl-CoA dioxygenase family protein n=1 Tax=Armatimonas sp. TaxID=1872638 RepID=UPI00286AFCB7|nr:phytanoyl-CoA dioxygenase family protein [Armatimonas sp.]